MTLYQFNALDEMEQAEAVWNGIFIDDRLDDQHNILLYQIDGFYVEAFYHRDHNELVRFRSFSNVEQLAPYLGKINLDELINSQ